MADDRIVYKFEGDSRGLISSLDKAKKAFLGLIIPAKKADNELEEVNKTTKKTAFSMADLNKATKSLGITLKSAAATSLTVAGAGLTAVAAIGKLSQSMAEAQNELSDLSARTGVATETLAGLKLAAEGSGQNLDDVAKALKPLVLRLGQVKQGSKTAIDGFKAVGVEVLKADGKLRSADDVLIEITKNLADMKDPTERAAAAALAFGSAGTKIVQALGDEDLATFIDAAERFGMDVGPEAAKAAADWQRAFANLKLVLTPFSSELLRFTTTTMRDFSLGFVFVKTLLEEISSFTLPELLAAFQLTLIDIGLFFSDIHDRVLLKVVNTILDMSWALSQLTGNDLEFKALSRRFDDIEFATTNTLMALRQTVAETNRLPGAFQKALAEAKAFFIFSNNSASDLQKTFEEIKPPTDWNELLEGITFKPFQQVVQEEMDAINKMINIRPAMEVLAEDRDRFMNVTSKMFSDYGNAFSNIVDLIVSKLGDLTKGQRAALMALYRTQQAAALTSIAIDTAQAVMKTVANIVPPLNIPAGIAVGLLGATQAAAVAAAPPPFHIGGVIPSGSGNQGVMINALPGESVLNRETTARLGKDGVNALNSGMGGEKVVIEMVYKHRIFDTFVADNLAKGGPLKEATKQGRRVGHRNGR